MKEPCLSARRHIFVMGQDKCLCGEAELLAYFPSEEEGPSFVERVGDEIRVITKIEDWNRQYFNDHTIAHDPE